MRKHKTTDKATFAALVRANRGTFLAAKTAKNEFCAAYYGAVGADVYGWPLSRLKACREAIVDGCNAYDDVCGVTWAAMFVIREIDGVIEDLTPDFE